MTETEYHVTNAIGVTIATADSEDLARKAIRDIHARWGWTGLSVKLVETTITERVVYRQRARQAERRAA